MTSLNTKTPTRLSSSPMTTVSDTSSSEAPASEALAVAITPVSLHQVARPVRRVFFPQWKPTKRWRFKLTRNQPWVFCCDRRNGEISFNQSRFNDREELRTAIILQLTLAWDIGEPTDALLEKLEDSRDLAMAIQRPELAVYIDTARRLAGSGNLDMLYDRVEDVVRTYNWLTPPAEPDLKPEELDPIFEDSMHFTQFGARLKKEQAYLSELRKNLRKHLPELDD